MSPLPARPPFASRLLFVGAITVGALNIGTGLWTVLFKSFWLGATCVGIGVVLTRLGVIGYRMDEEVWQ